MDNKAVSAYLEKSSSCEAALSCEAVLSYKVASSSELSSSCKGTLSYEANSSVEAALPCEEALSSDTGCFTMNDTKVFVYFSGYDASSDLKHVAKFYLH